MRGLILILLITFSQAQTLNYTTIQSNNNTQSISIASGLEYGLNYLIEYHYFIDNRFHIDTKFQSLWVELGFDEYYWDAGITYIYFNNELFKTTITFKPLIRGTRNNIATLTSLAFDSATSIGFYTSGFYFTTSLGYTLNTITYIKNSDLYRKTVYSNAVDGWYNTFGGILYYDLVIGGSIGCVDIYLRMGQMWDNYLNTKMLPFFATFGINYNF